MKIKNLCFALFFILCTALIFSSCAQKGYSEVYSCSELTKALESEILSEETYGAYSHEDVKYMFDDDTLFDSYSIIYSSSSEDIGEVGILHAPTSESAEELLDEANEYLSSLNEEKRAFLKSYLPYELEKLDYAEAKRYGNYVVFVVQDQDTRNAVFAKLEALLS